MTKNNYYISETLIKDCNFPSALFEAIRNAHDDPNLVIIKESDTQKKAEEVEGVNK